jgi:hypothetical protein
MMFYSDLAATAATTADNSGRVNERIAVIKLDNASTLINNTNHTYRTQDLMYYDIAGCEHGTNFENNPANCAIAGDHQLQAYNTKGGTLNGGNLVGVQGNVTMNPGHGGDITFYNMSGVVGNNSVQANTGEFTRVTNLASFLALGGAGGTGSYGTNQVVTNRYAFRQVDQSSSSGAVTNDYSFATEYHAARAKPGAIERFREYGKVATHSAAGTYTVDAANNLHIVTLGANITSFTMSNFPAVTSQSAAVTLLLVQDGTGGRSVTFTAGASETFKFANGTTSSSITAANDIQVVYVFSRYNGSSTTYYWTIGPSFS